jgi:hypothetical protein
MQYCLFSLLPCGGISVPCSSAEFAIFCCLLPLLKPCDVACSAAAVLLPLSVPSYLQQHISSNSSSAAGLSGKQLLQVLQDAAARTAAVVAAAAAGKITAKGPPPSAAAAEQEEARQRQQQQRQVAAGALCSSHLLRLSCPQLLVGYQVGKGRMKAGWLVAAGLWCDCWLHPYSGSADNDCAYHM